MVMTAVAVVIRVIVPFGCNRPGVDVRSEVVSAGLTPAVRVAEGSG